MRRHTRSTASVVALSLLLSGSAAQAVTIDWVTVGNPGNTADTLVMINDGTSGYGSVGYAYRISKHEVTNTQYAEFLNAVASTGQLDPNALYDTNMGSDPRGGITRTISGPNFTYAAKADMGNKPVNYITWYDAVRFANWLHNNQPTGPQVAGTTEGGAYTLTGLTSISGGRALSATVFLPSENEWYKAGYHEPGADTNDYWLYPTRSNASPTVAAANATGDISNPSPTYPSPNGVANYLSGADWNSQDGNVTTVGTAGAGSASFYGTFDQGGHLWEWNEAIIGGSDRAIRGGSWNNDSSIVAASFRLNVNPGVGDNTFGFRVASTAAEAVPEPSTFVMAGLGLLGLGFVALRRSIPGLNALRT